MAVTLMKVNSFNTRQQSMKLESYLHISDPLLWPGVKATRGPYDQIDSLLERKASNINSILGCMWAWPGVPNKTKHKEQQLKVSDLCGQLEASGEEFTINDVEVKQELQRQSSHNCVRCQANVTTLCNIWTTVYSLYEVRGNTDLCPKFSYKMCYENFLRYMIILMTAKKSSNA